MNYTTAQVAAALGCDRSTVTRAAKRLGVGRRHANSLAFTAADVRRLRAAIADGPGNPEWIAAGKRRGR